MSATAIDLSRDYFTLPPGEYYTSEAVFAEEFHKVFSRQWNFAGHMSQFPRCGSFITLDFAGESLLIVRGEGEHFYGHFNVCRHRGFPMCQEDSGTVRALVCGYHAWRFDLDGSLTRVPNMGDGEVFDYQDFPLKSFAVDTWHGMIFFHLGAHPQPLADVFAGFEQEVASFNVPGTRLAHEVKLDIEANWKVSAENFNECYHCAGTHKSFSRVINVPRMQAEGQSWFDPDSEANAHAGGSSGMPMTDGWQTLSTDGSLISKKLLGACTVKDAEVGHTAGMHLLPNYFAALFFVDHWWVQTVIPLSAGRSRMTFRWYVRDDAVEGTDYDLENLVRVMQTTYLEDVSLIENAYKGMKSRTFTPGPITAKNEPLMYSFVSNYWSLMGYSPDGPAAR